MFGTYIIEGSCIDLRIIMVYSIKPNTNKLPTDVVTDGSMVQSVMNGMKLRLLLLNPTIGIRS
jgi:hypothetical protein